MIRCNVISALLLVSVTTVAEAQTSRYSTVDRSDRLQEMVDQLRTLIDEADRARAADRRFIGDLRDLVQTYDWPWNTQIFFDDFRDGDFVNAPRWQLVKGGFRVEKGLGLHTLDQPVKTREEPEQQSSQDSGRDLATAMLESLLGQNQSESSGSAGEQAQAPTYGTLQLEAEIPNAFALELELRAVGQQGEIAFIVFTSGEQREAYRVIYAPGVSPTIEIQRLTRHGKSVIAAYHKPLDIHDGAFHRLVWTRHSSGEMQIKLDDRVLVSTSDRTIEKPFGVFRIRHTGGNFAVREVGLWGAK